MEPGGPSPGSDLVAAAAGGTLASGTRTAASTRWELSSRVGPERPGRSRTSGSGLADLGSVEANVLFSGGLRARRRALFLFLFFLNSSRLRVYWLRFWWSAGAGQVWVCCADAEFRVVMSHRRAVT